VCACQDWEQLDVTFAALIDQGEEGSLLDILNKYVGLPDVWKRLARLAVTVGVKLGKAAFVQLLVDQGAVDAEFLASEWLADKVAFDNNMDMIATFLKAGLVFEGARTFVGPACCVYFLVFLSFVRLPTGPHACDELQ